MDHNERQAIEELFGKLAEVERRAPPRDSEAEALISEKVVAQPGAPYYMAQTIVVQEQALIAAQRRIEELEQKAQGGGLLGSIFGGGSRATASRAAVRQPEYGTGSGFLAGAAQTALGVTGGIFLASLIGGMFAGGAQAAEPQSDLGGDEGGDDLGLDDGDGFDVGGFDFGGDF